MTPTGKYTAGPNHTPPLWWRGLAVLCCLLAFLPSGLPNLLLPNSQAQSSAPLPTDAGERSPAPMEEDDDNDLDEQACETARPQHERQLRERRPAYASSRTEAWLSHLPHGHVGVAGYSLPSHSPFAAGASCLPLRC